MGHRGPLRDPDSRRGKIEGTSTLADAPEAPAMPGWLSKGGKAAFAALVRDLIAARVPLKTADGHAVAMASHCIAEAQVWARRERRRKSVEEKLDCARQVARFQRDSQTWLAAIGGTPASRARMGVKAAPPKAKGTVLRIVAAQKERG